MDRTNQVHMQQPRAGRYSFRGTVAHARAGHHTSLGVRLAAKYGSRSARANAASVLMTAAAVRRCKKPWEELARVGALQGNDSTADYVRRHLQTYAFRHEWLP